MSHYRRRIFGKKSTSSLLSNKWLILAFHLFHTENINVTRGARRASTPGGRDRHPKDNLKAVLTNPLLATHQSEWFPLPSSQGKAGGVIPSKVYVGEMQRHPEMWVTEHRDACKKGDTWKSATTEHQWDQQHRIDWDVTRVLDGATKPIQQKVKGHCIAHREDPHIYQAQLWWGYEFLGYWITTIYHEEARLGGGANMPAPITLTQALQPLHQTRASAGATPINHQHFRTLLHYYPWNR